MPKEAIQLFDTTLRDGQQCPGAGMSFEHNIQYAILAAKIGIDILEAGFPAAGQLDFEIVQTIAKELMPLPQCPIIAALCQLREKQFDITIEALSPAIAQHKARLHTYLPVDPHLIQASLGQYAKQPKKIIEDVHRLIKHAVDSGVSVELSPEGYSRMGDNFDFVSDVIRAAVAAGASIINCPDTIGGACYLQGDDYFVENMKKHAKLIQQEFPDKNITWSTHCHNDFGLALENSMRAVFFGPARQIEGCFNGVGERAGNVSLEQCIIYIEHFGKNTVSNTEFYTQMKLEHMQAISDFISQHMLPRQPHWPITGDNAAKHTSGGHTNAILNNPLAYQPFDPKQIGKEITFVFGPLSGGNHAKSIINQHGYLCTDDEKAAIAQFIKDYYAERRKGITEQELMHAYFIYRHPIKAKSFNYKKSGSEIVLRIMGQFFDNQADFRISYQGNDSVLAALNKAISRYMPDLTIETYNSEAASKGINAKSKSKIVISYQGNLFTGESEDHDIEVSALKTLASATNQAYVEHHFKL